MVLDKGVVLDGIVMWTDGVSRPHGSLMYKCPTGDVTGDELAACTVWQGVIYSVGRQGQYRAAAGRRRRMRRRR